MTTAHRPTWNSAKGGSEQGGNLLVEPSRAYSSKDLPAHQKLKSRRVGQGSLLEQKEIDFKRQLLEEEGDEDDFKVPLPVKKVKIEENEEPKIIPGYVEKEPDNPVDPKDEVSEPEEQEVVESSGGDDESGEDEDDSEDEEELWREFEKMKKEKEAEKARKEQEKIEQLKQQEEEEIITGNPLLASHLNSEYSDKASNAYSLKKKWYEETVFKNQAKDLKGDKKRFINDTVRNDFHRKFMGKYLQ